MSLLKVSVKQIDTAAIGETVFATVSQVNAVQDNVANAGGGDTSNAWVNANDYLTFSTVTANLYDTYTSLNANLGGSVSSQRFNTSASSNTFTLVQNVSSANSVLVSLSGVVQVPEEAYVVSGNVLTLSNSVPLLSNLRLEVRYL